MVMTKGGNVNPERRADNGISDSAVSAEQPDGGAANTVRPRTDMDTEQAESAGASHGAGKSPITAPANDRGGIRKGSAGSGR